MVFPRMRLKKPIRKKAMQALSGVATRVRILASGVVNTLNSALVCMVVSLLVWSSSISATPAHTVSYHGIPLQVESRREIAPGTLQLFLGGESFVIAEAEAGRGVLLRLLSNSSEELTPSLVQSVARRSAQIPDGEVLEATLGVIFQHDEWTEFDAHSAWQDISASEVGRARLVSALSKVVGGNITDVVCSSVRALFEFPPTLQVELLARQVSPECRKVGARRAIREVFRGHDLGAAAQDVQRLAIIFEDDLPAGQRSLREVSAAISDLQSVLAKSDASKFESAVLTLDEVGRGFAVLDTDRDPSRLREKFIVEAVTRGSFRSALAVLSTVQPDRRTPDLHAAVIRALDGLGADEIADAITPDVQAALRVFAEKDEEIALRNQMVVQRGAEFCLGNAKLEDAYRLLHGALTTQGALPAKLTPVGLRVVRAFLEGSDSKQADNVALSLNVRPGIFLAARLALARAGLSLGSVFLAVLVLITCFAGWYIRLSNRRRIEARGQDDREADSQAGSSRSTLARRGRGCSEELAGALATFGLQPGASLSDIKNAYRARVKECHPDRTPHASSGDNDEFVRLTAEYDRLLMLYRRDYPTST